MLILIALTMVVLALGLGYSAFAQPTQHSLGVMIVAALVIWLSIIAGWCIWKAFR